MAALIFGVAAPDTGPRLAQGADLLFTVFLDESTDSPVRHLDVVVAAKRREANLPAAERERFAAAAELVRERWRWR